MKREKISLLLKSLNSGQTGLRSGWVLGHCPLGPWRHDGRDNNPSFAIRENTKEKSICKCMSCGFGGDLMDLLFRLKGLYARSPAPGYNFTLASSMIANEFEDMELNPQEIPEYGAPTKSDDVVFPDWWLESFQLASKFPEAMEYLKSRSVSKKMVEYLDVRFDPLQKRVGFPFRNFKGQIMGVQGRSIEKDSTLRYYQYGYQDHRNAHVWMNEHRLDLDLPVVLVEGPLDLSSVLRVYPNVAASFTSGLSKQKMKRLGDASEIITFYDYGAGGSAARASLSEFFKNIPVSHVIPAAQQDDAGSMSVEEVWSVLEDRVPLEPFN